MKTLLLFLLLVCSSAFALDSGTYYNPERDGEGLQLTRSGDLVQIFFYTYEPYQGCWNVELPDTGLVTRDNCHEQRFFMSGGDHIAADRVEGWLYSTVGLDYHIGIVDPLNPFLSRVGEAHVVGLYILERKDAGWRMVVVQFGDLLDGDDPLYTEVFEFSQVLLQPTD